MGKLAQNLREGRHSLENIIVTKCLAIMACLPEDDVKFDHLPYVGWQQDCTNRNAMILSLTSR